MNKNFKFIIVAFAIVLIIAGIIWIINRESGTFKEETDEVKVVVSIIPQKYFVERIGGDKVDVSYMVEKGASPATYEPKPSQVEDLSEADLYVKIGVPFEKANMSKFIEANDLMEIWDQGEGIEKIEITDHHHGEEEEEHDEEEKDPHIWLSVKRAKKQAETIFRALVSVDKGNEKYYNENLNNFYEEIEAIDEEMENIFSDKGELAFMIFHPSLGYIANDYDLEQIAIEVEGKEPSIAELEEILEIAEEEDIKTIFVQDQFDQKTAEIVANEIGAEVMTVDPLALDWGDNIINIAKKLAEVD